MTVLLVVAGAGVAFVIGWLLGRRSTGLPHPDTATRDDGPALANEDVLELHATGVVEESGFQFWSTKDVCNCKKP